MRLKFIDAFISLTGALGVFYPLSHLDFFGIGLISGIVGGLIVSLIILFTIQKAREISIPQALAYGYFFSFLERSITHITGKAILISNGMEKDYEGEKVKIKILFPKHLRDLETAIDEVHSDKYRRVSLKTDGKPFGVFVHHPNANEAVIVDVPNNLRTLKNYLIRQYKSVDKKKWWYSKRTVGQEALEEYKETLNKVIEERQYQNDALREIVIDQI